MHERLQRKLCRVFFLLACLLPTLWVFGLAFRTNWPGRNFKQADWLSQNLGITTTLQSLDSPLPGLDRYQGLTLCVPESTRPMLWANTLQVYPDAERLHLSVDTLEISEADFSSLAEWLERRFLISPWMRPITLTAKRVQIVRPQKNNDPKSTKDSTVETLARYRDVRIRLDRVKNSESPASQSLGCALRIQMTPVVKSQSDKAVEKKKEAPIQIVITRTGRFDESRPTTSLKIQTGAQGELPAGLLAKLLPGTATIKESRFRGQIELVFPHARDQKTSGRLAGEFTNIRYGALLGAGQQEVILGQGTLGFVNLTWNKGKIEQAKGVFVGGAGSVSTRWLGYLQKQLFFQLPNSGLNTATEFVSFEQMKYAFVLNQRGIRLIGYPNQTSEKRSVLSDTRQMILAEPLEVISWKSLLQTFYPEVSMAAPLDQTGRRLVDLLPIYNLGTGAVSERVEVSQQPLLKKDLR